MAADDLLRAFTGIVGAAHVLTAEAAQPFLSDWRGRFHGAALAVLRPGSTAEVASLVQLCAQQGLAIVPQGGNTGLCGGATPDASGHSVVLHLGRLNRVRELDLDNDTLTVEAGCILQTVQEVAARQQRLFPLSLGAEGSCTIGGNLATNAGGTQVLRYGNARELCLGLEVVMADGQIWQGLRGLRKDNTGYDLRDLFIGSEGSLGIITAATLKLFAQPAAQCTALLALPDLASAIALLRRARAGFGPALTGYELMAKVCLDSVQQCYPQQRLPLGGEAAQAPWFALLELSDAEGQDHARAQFEAVLGEALEAGEAIDVAIAENVGQAHAMWHLRESITLAQAELGKSLKHDVALPISAIAEFVQATDAALQARYPGLLNMTFGHLGDGNLHYNVGTSAQFSDAQLLEHQADIYTLVHDAVHARNGSISAEHGVGQLKVAELPRYKSVLELDVMRRIKAALDPQGILNPGKVLHAARP